MARRDSILILVLVAAILATVSLLASAALYSGDEQPQWLDPGGVISGTLASRDASPGTIYILALYPVGTDGIRRMEVEAQPYASQYVAAYTSLAAPGPYRIQVPESGDYILYAWKDVDGDGGIDHKDYREPSGWYHAVDYLLPSGVRVTPGSDVAGIDITLIAPTPYSGEERSVHRGDGGGTLKHVRGYPVLHLWGTDEARAYAQGYLVGPQIRDWVEFVVVEYYAQSPSLYEDILLPYIRNNCSGDDLYTPLADAMLQGMQDSGTRLSIDALRRDVTPDDIVACNSLYTLMLLKDYVRSVETAGENRFMCSNAVVWGNLTQNAELAGGVIHGKNLDGERDLRKVSVNTLLIVATEPEQGSGKRRVVGVDWPGLFGTYNAMNEDGLIMVSHSMWSYPNFSATDLLEYSTLYIDTLQRCGTISEAEAYWKSLNVTRTGGWSTALSEPYASAADGIPSVTFESDSYGMAVRRPGDIPPGGIPAILTTNHFYAYGKEAPEAAATSGNQTPIQPTHYRYIAMNDTIQRFMGEGRSIGTPEMVEILQFAANSTDYRGITEYSYIGYPDTRSFAVAQEDLERRILDAPYANFTAFTFEEVFR